ncbi:MAG: hypothetical protein ACLUAR_02690 [Pilosibacter sp.]
MTLRKQLRLSNDRAAKALAAYNYRVVKYIGAYTAAMDGVDVIAFQQVLVRTTSPQKSCLRAFILLSIRDLTTRLTA